MSPALREFLEGQKVLAFVLALAMLFWSIGLPGWVNRAEAALTQVSDTLSDSGISDGSNHTISFTIDNQIIGADTAGATSTVITFPVGFDLTTNSVASTDIDITDDSTDLTIGTACGAVQAAVNVYSDHIDIQFCNGTTIATSSVVEVEIGTNATSQVAGANQIINPSTTGSYTISIAGGTMVDSGSTIVAITEDVTVTAAVGQTFTFTVSGVGPGSTFNDESVTTFASSTATTVPFGTVSPGSINAKTMAQLLTVQTNAPSGYTVTVNADQTLTSGGAATIDEFIDGAGTGSSTVWTSPTGTFGTPDTYGHWGLTSDDDDVGSSTLVYGVGTPLYVGNFITNPAPVMYHNGPTNGTTQGQGTTTVGYKIEITALQEAGSDYTATLTYVATPVF